MPKRDARVDTYIAKSPEFAQPILNHIRKLVLEACPEAEETLKWSFPNFLYKGMLCSVAAFKNHCSFGFWKRKLIFVNKKVSSGEGMGQFGRITSISDLPPKNVLLGYIKEAVRLNEEGVKVPKARPKRKKPLAIPAPLKSALSKNKKALATFENFSYTHKKEYVDWINEAKREETRDQRLTSAIKWMAEGKSRHNQSAQVHWSFLRLFFISCLHFCWSLQA